MPLTLRWLPPALLQVQIAAINDIGEGARSQIATYRAAIEPAAIQNVVHYSSTAASITFAWVAPSSNGATIYSYEGEVRGQSAESARSHFSVRRI